MQKQAERATAGRSKLFLLVFAISTALFALGIYWLQTPLGKDLFKSTPTARDAMSASIALSQRRAVDVQGSKIAHALANPRYEVGLFGNSRAVAVSRTDLQGVAAPFFNFSVPGTSFRASVMLVEYLAKHDALPPHVFISIDNFHLDYYGPADFPFQTVRLAAIINDALAGFGRDDIPRRETARAVLRGLWQEWNYLTDPLNATFVQTVLTGPAEKSGALSSRRQPTRSIGSRASHNLCSA